MGFKASGEENRVTAKGRPCYLELTELPGTSCRCMWFGPWQGSSEGGGWQTLGETPAPHHQEVLGESSLHVQSEQAGVKDSQACGPPTGRF